MNFIDVATIATFIISLVITVTLVVIKKKRAEYGHTESL